MEEVNNRLYGAGKSTPSLGSIGGGDIGGGDIGGGGLRGIANTATNLIGDVKDFSNKMIGGGGLGDTSPSLTTRLASVTGQLGMKKGGKVKAKPAAKSKAKPKTSPASKRADGIAQRGKTRGKMV